MADVGSNRARPIDVATIVGALLAALYAFAVVGSGLYGAAANSYPQRFGLRRDGDLKPNFPYGAAAFVWAIAMLALGAVLVVSVVRTLRNGRRARWVTVGWLSLAIVVTYLAVRNPSDHHRCPVDSYTDQPRCISVTAVTIRDLALFALPALVAIACLVVGSRRRSSSDPKGEGEGPYWVD